MVRSIKRYIAILSLLFGLAFTLPANQVEALSCAPDERPPLKQMQNADAVFIGTVLTNAKASDQESRGEFRDLFFETRVAQAVKGVSGGEEVLVYVDRVYGSKPNVGEKYFMILSDEDGRLTEPLCSELPIVEADNKRVAAYTAEFDNVREQTPPKKETAPNNNTERYTLLGLAVLGTGFILGYGYKKTRTAD